MLRNMVTTERGCGYGNQMFMKGIQSLPNRPRSGDSVFLGSPPPQRLIYRACVENIMKTIRFRIEPNASQREAIDQMIDANRLVYNNMVTACKIKYDKDGKIPSEFDLNRMGTRIRRNTPYVAKAHSMTLNETSKRVVQAFKKTLGDHEKETGMFFVETMRSRCAGTASPGTNRPSSSTPSHIPEQWIIPS